MGNAQFEGIHSQRCPTLGKTRGFEVRLAAVHTVEPASVNRTVFHCRQLFYDCGFGGARGGADDYSVDGDADLMSQHRALVFFQTKKMLSLVINLLS